MFELRFRNTRRIVSKLILIGIFFGLMTTVVFSQTEVVSTDTVKNDKYIRVAILPFDNVSGEPDAARRITSIFLTQLFSRDKFIRVVELGEVERVLIEERVRNTGEIEVDTAKKLGEKLNVHYLVLGSVVEYKFVRIGNNDLPVMGVTARAIDTKTGSLIWSSHEYGRGNQKEKVFGIGRIVSFSELSEIIVKKLVDSFEKKVVALKYQSK